MTDDDLEIAYTEGRNAFRDGLRIEDNPYKDRDNLLTVNWVVGYEDAFAEEDIFLDLQEIDSALRQAMDALESDADLEAKERGI